MREVKNSQFMSNATLATFIMSWILLVLYPLPDDVCTGLSR